MGATAELGVGQAGTGISGRRTAGGLACVWIAVRRKGQRCTVPVLEEKWVMRLHRGVQEGLER